MLFALAVLAAAQPLLAQQPAPATKSAPADRRPGEAPVLEQQRVGIAYREMQQAQFEAKLAEQDVQNTQDAFNATRARADTLKAELDKAVKARDAAKAKEAAARKRYDDALNAVPR
jgi:septal ring factor EnvC (AmiA/AmiB activator)